MDSPSIPSTPAAKRTSFGLGLLSPATTPRPQRTASELTTSRPSSPSPLGPHSTKGPLSDFYSDCDETEDLRAQVSEGLLREATLEEALRKSEGRNGQLERRIELLSLLLGGAVTHADRTEQQLQAATLVADGLVEDLAAQDQLRVALTETLTSVTQSLHDIVGLEDGTPEDAAAAVVGLVAALELEVEESEATIANQEETIEQAAADYATLEVDLQEMTASRAEIIDAVLQLEVTVDNLRHEAQILETMGANAEMDRLLSDLHNDELQGQVAHLQDQVEEAEAQVRAEMNVNEALVEAAEALHLTIAEQRDDIEDLQADLTARGAESGARLMALLALQDDFEALNEQLGDALGREETLKDRLRAARRALNDEVRVHILRSILQLT